MLIFSWRAGGGGVGLGSICGRVSRRDHLSLAPGHESTVWKTVSHVGEIYATIVNIHDRLTPIGPYSTQERERLYLFIHSLKHV